jgi:hypothetical protein
MKYTFNQKIIPNRLICNNSFYNIKVINSKFIINEFCIHIDKNNKISSITITDGIHPNCNLKNKVVCIPDYLKNLELNKDTMKIIINILEIFNFDSAFFQPWDSFEYLEEGMTNNE